MIPGEYLLGEEEIEIYLDLPLTTLLVSNTGDRPIQIGSHYHFAEANRALTFSRAEAWGKHLALPAGTSARFEPGESLTVTLVPFAGNRFLQGHSGLVSGPLDLEAPAKVARLIAAGFKNIDKAEGKSQ